MFNVIKMMAGTYWFFYKALEGMGGLILLIIVGIVVIIYFLQAYLIYLMILLGLLTAARIFLWFRMRYW